MMKMTKKTIMLSTAALVAASALSFGPVSYKVSAADPVVVESVEKWNSIHTQIDSDLEALIDPAVIQINSIVDNTSAEDLLPALWEKLEYNVNVDETAVEALVKEVIKDLIQEMYTDSSSNLSNGLNVKLNELATALGQDAGYPTLNKTDVANFVIELEKKVLENVRTADISNIVGVEDAMAAFSLSLDEVIPAVWGNTSLEVVKFLRVLYPSQAALKADLVTMQTEIEANATNMEELKLAGAALGLAYVKAGLVNQDALGTPRHLSSTKYSFPQFKILGAQIKGLPVRAFKFTAPGLTFTVEGDYLVATSATPITTATTFNVEATLRTDVIPVGLRGADVFTQTVTLRPNSGNGEFIDTGLNLVPNATAISQAINGKIDAALDGIGEVDTNRDIFALRALVEDELRSALTVNAAGQLTHNNGIAELKLSATDLSGVLSQVDAIVKTANDALQAAVPDADPVKPVFNLSVGNQADVKVVLSSELLDALKAKGIYAIGVISNGVVIEVPLSELEGNSVLQVTKTTGITPELKDGMKQVSDVFNVSVFDAAGKEKHEFKSQARLVLPVNSGDVTQVNYLTLAKIEEDELINLGGAYNPAKTQFSAMRNTFSSYVVIENPVSFKDISALAWAEDDILKAAAKGIIVGRAEGVFAPRAEITRAEFTAMLVRTLGIEAVSHTEAFTDVNDSDWYQSVVATAAAYGFINGRSNTEFDPNAPITRSEMATITSNVLVKVIGYNPVSDVNEALNMFTDQDEVVPAHRAGVALVAQEGIVQGKGLGIYDPKGTFTRAEAAVVINVLLSLR